MARVECYGSGEIEEINIYRLAIPNLYPKIKPSLNTIISEN